MSFLEEEYKNTLEICTYYIENSNLLYLKFWKQEPAAGAEIYGVLFDKIHEAREIIFETHEFRKIEFETHEKKLTLAIGQIASFHDSDIQGGPRFGACFQLEH